MSEREVLSLLVMLSVARLSVARAGSPRVVIPFVAVR